MALLRIFQDTKGISQCRTCEATIQWATLESGSKVPFDPPIVAVKTEGSILTRVVEIVDTTITSPHFQTCPFADYHRRRR